MVKILSHYSEHYTHKNIRVVYFWNFPVNSFKPWLTTVTKTTNSEITGKGGTTVFKELKEKRKSHQPRMLYLQNSQSEREINIFSEKQQLKEFIMRTFWVKMK